MEFTLRNWDFKDIESVAFHANNKKLADNLRDQFPYPYTIGDAELYINTCINSDASKNIFYAVDVDGKAVGSIGVFMQEDIYRKSAEIGYWLGEEYWNKGIMSKAISQISERAFKRFDIVRIFAITYIHNTGSRKALEKAGFELEGVLRKSVVKDGNIYDTCVFSLIKL